MLIFLVRHGESEANLNKKVHDLLPDHSIPLTKKGIEQSHIAGQKIRHYIQHHNIKTSPQWDNENLTLWQSPYLRTRQTAAEISKVCWIDDQVDEPSSIIDVIKEDVALCEQQFGLFDGLSDEELREKYPAEHAHYQKCERDNGRFWARPPLGESRFDVTMRVQQAFGTWHRDLSRHNINKIVVVAHGVTIRAILMRWLHLPFEWFENEHNPPNGSVRIIEDDNDRGYL